MIPNKVKEISGGHCVNIRVEIISAETDSRRGDGRLQQVEVADTSVPAVPLYLVVMNFDDLVKPEKGRFNQSASLLRARPYFVFAFSRDTWN